MDDTKAILPRFCALSLEDDEDGMSQGHDDRGGAALLWCKTQISDRYFTEHPVSAILEVTTKLVYKEDIERDIGPDKNNARTRTRDAMLLDIHRRLGATHATTPSVVVMGGRDVSIPFIAQDSKAKHFLTVSPHADSVKAAYLKEVIRQANADFHHATRSTIDQHGEDDKDAYLSLFEVASVSFILARPLDYFPMDIQPE
jgi:hypothetical protein